MARDESTDRPTSVYKYYDEIGLLLYVGITNRGLQRNNEHNTTKEWWRFVRSQEVEHHTTRRGAEVKERDLIRKYRPPFNIVYNPGHKEIRQAYLEFRDIKRPVTVPQLVQKQLPQSKRIELSAQSIGSTIILNSHSDAAHIVSALDLDGEEGFHIATAGRRAKLASLTREDGILYIRLLAKGAPPCIGAELMYRLPAPPHNNSITIKRIDLRFDPTPSRAA